MHKEEWTKGGKLHHVDLDINPAWQTAKCCHRREDGGRGQGRRGGWEVCHPLPTPLSFSLSLSYSHSHSPLMPLLCLFYNSSIRNLLSTSS